MVLDPATGALILGGADFLGGLFGGAAASRQAKRELALKAELGRRGLGIQETQLAPNAAHLLETSGLRDKVLATLMARVGQAPQQFKPTDILGGTNFSPQMGGIDMGKLQGQMDAYTPGSGGVNPDLYKAMLARLGYMNPQGQVLRDQSQVGGTRTPAPMAPKPLPANMNGNGLFGNLKQRQQETYQRNLADYNKRNMVG